MIPEPWERAGHRSGPGRDTTLCVAWLHLGEFVQSRGFVDQNRVACHLVRRPPRHQIEQPRIVRFPCLVRIRPVASPHQPLGRRFDDRLPDADGIGVAWRTAGQMLARARARLPPGARNNRGKIERSARRFFGVVYLWCRSAAAGGGRLQRRLLAGIHRLGARAARRSSAFLPIHSMSSG